MGLTSGLKAIALNVMSVPAQTGPVADEVILTDVDIGGSTENTAWFDVAVGLVTHTALLVNIQVMMSPLFKLLLVNCWLPVPVFCPFTIHWYKGLAPPLVMVAVNATGFPRQSSAVEGETVTVGVTAAFTVKVSVACEVPSLAVIFEVPAPVICILPATMVATAGLLLV